MKKMRFLTTMLAAMLLSGSLMAQVIDPRPPIMGWASWNNYRVNINENIIKAQADEMVENGMKEAGYNYINTDDGYFGGRDSEGNIIVNKERFPGGMAAIARHIHSRGLKAGIYSDAGINTCGSRWDKDSISMGNGMYGHEYRDIKLMLDEWNFDFLKVDWCGADWMGLDEETQYTKISKLIYSIKPNATFNVCRWQFPGKWVTAVADSWRISGDISNTFSSIANIIDLNADLWMYCSPGHYNDMDMLQVGRGMSYEEDKAHFTMWCVMVSPLLAGNDLTTMSKQTLEILTNRDVIALNQDPLFYQARRVVDNGELEVWAKPLKHTMSGKVAVVLLNRSEIDSDISFNLDNVAINSDKGYTMRDLWSKKSYNSTTDKAQTFNVPSHGVVTLLIDGKSLPFNVFQEK